MATSSATVPVVASLNEWRTWTVLVTPSNGVMWTAVRLITLLVLARSLISLLSFLIDLSFSNVLLCNGRRDRFLDVDSRKLDMAASCASRITYVALRHKLRNFVIAAAQDGCAC